MFIIIILIHYRGTSRPTQFRLDDSMYCDIANFGGRRKLPERLRDSDNRSTLLIMTFIHQLFGINQTEYTDSVDHCVLHLGAGLAVDHKFVIDY